jgi:hypothetical protein
MSWDDRRTAGAVGTIARQAAHSDDAKHRADETTHLRPRARWVAPVAIGAAVLLLGGGATAVALTGSRGGGGHQASASPGPTASKSSSSSPTPRQPTGATVAGHTFTLSGSMHTVVRAFHGAAGSVGDHDNTFTFTCGSSSCSGKDLLGQPIELPSAGANDYLLLRHEHDPQIQGTLNYVQTFRLTIHGKSATYVITVPKGAINERANGEDLAPPRTSTLTAPMVFTD